MSRDPVLLVTGASGFVGSRLCEQALKDAWQVRRALRRNSAEGVVVGEIGPTTDWSAALADVDTVIHLAARVHVMEDAAADPLAEFRRINTEGTARLARQAAAAGVRRLVLVSSIKVNGEATAGQPFSEQDPPDPQDPYAVSKAEAEAALWEVCAETGLEGVVVRPPLVYGPGVRGNFERLMALVARGMPLPLGAVANKRSLVGRDNLVDLLLTAVRHPAAANQVFLAADGEDLSTTDLLRRMGAALDRPVRLLPVPVATLRAGGKLLGKKAMIDRLCGSLQVDLEKTRRLLDWTPPLTVDEGLRLTAEDYLRHGGVRGA